MTRDNYLSKVLPDVLIVVYLIGSLPYICNGGLNCGIYITRVWRRVNYLNA